MSQMRRNLGEISEGTVEANAGVAVGADAVQTVGKGRPSLPDAEVWLSEACWSRC